MKDRTLQFHLLEKSYGSEIFQDRKISEQECKSLLIKKNPSTKSVEGFFSRKLQYRFCFSKIALSVQEVVALKLFVRKDLPLVDLQDESLFSQKVDNLIL